MFAPLQHFSTIKINRSPIVTELDALKDSLPSQDAGISAPECFYPDMVEKVENKTCIARKLTIRHSVYKLALMAKVVQGMHIYDA